MTLTDITHDVAQNSDSAAYHIAADATSLYAETDRICQILSNPEHPVHRETLDWAANILTREERRNILDWHHDDSRRILAASDELSTRIANAIKSCHSSCLTRQYWLRALNDTKGPSYAWQSR